MSFWGKAFAVVCIVALVACERAQAPASDANAEAPAVQEPVRETIIGSAAVTDGDTIRIGERRIRFDGIDAPERDARCGDVDIYAASTQTLTNIIAGREVSCVVTGDPDQYGREIARCSVAGQDLNSSMVQQGAARDWPRYSGGEYADEEATARAAQVGVWAPSCGNIWPADRDYTRR